MVLALIAEKGNTSNLAEKGKSEHLHYYQSLESNKERTEEKTEKSERKK